MKKKNACQESSVAIEAIVFETSCSISSNSPRFIGSLLSRCAEICISFIGSTKLQFYQKATVPISKVTQTWSSPEHLLRQHYQFINSNHPFLRARAFTNWYHSSDTNWLIWYTKKSNGDRNSGRGDLHFNSCGKRALIAEIFALMGSALHFNLSEPNNFHLFHIANFDSRQLVAEDCVEKSKFRISAFVPNLHHQLMPFDIHRNFLKTTGKMQHSEQLLTVISTQRKEKWPLCQEDRMLLVLLSSITHFLGTWRRFNFFHEVFSKYRQPG